MLQINVSLNENGAFLESLRRLKCSLFLNLLSRCGLQEIDFSDYALCYNPAV